MSERTALRSASACGIVGVAVYVFAVVLGGLLDPAYSQAKQTISELTGAGAPHRELLAPLFILYNVLIAAFGYLLHRAIPRDRLIAGATLLLGLSGIAGILLVTLLPTDLRGATPTMAGTLHIVVAGLASLLTVGVTFVLGVAFGRVGLLRPLSFGTLLAGIAILASGPVTAVAVATNDPVQGVFERITIGLFLLWVWSVSVFLLLDEESAGAFGPRARAVRL